MKGFCTNAAFAAALPRLARASPRAFRYSIFEAEGIPLFGVIARTVGKCVL